MMTSSNEIFSALLALCEGNPSVADGFLSQRTRSFDVFFDMRLNKLRKQSRRGYFGRHSVNYDITIMFGSDKPPEPVIALTTSDMETFSVILAFCEGNALIIGGFPA